MPQARTGYPAAPVPRRDFDAILLDLDGTLVDGEERVHPRTSEALHAAARAGVKVMIATGRSELATVPVIESLGLEEPAIVYNGAGVWCPRQREFLEERVLSERTLTRAIGYGLERGLLTVTMGAGRKRALRPRREVERMALREMHALTYVEPGELAGPYTMRVTVFSDEHAGSEAFCAEVERALGQPAYLTHFPLSVLPHHRESQLLVVDVHPPCRGKAEGLRVLEERHAIPARRVVAVGDATNDLPMLRAAGLAVAVEGGMQEALEAAQRVIGPAESGAIGELVEQLFLAY